MNNFNVGDRVILTNDRKYTNGTIILAGSKGVVEKVYLTWKGYIVYFHDIDQYKKVSEKFLVQG